VSVAFVDVAWAGRPVRIEHAWVGDAEPRTSEVLVFLHEGLGSVSMWRDFPERLCTALGMRGLVYSRPGYGRSTPRAEGERWNPDFMHRQAHELLPTLLAALGVQAPYALFGHSDGGSIALLHAARFPGRVSRAVVLAPHILVEDLSITGIEAARTAYETTDLRQRLARHHDDPDSAFRGWNGIWLDARFRGWNIAAEIGTISCPLLAVQGLDDEYGTLAQIRGIRERVPHTQLLELPACGHSPHRDQPGPLIAACGAFFPHHTTTEKTP